MRSTVLFTLLLLLSSCVSTVSFVDTDDTYMMKHVDTQGNTSWYRYQRSYVNPNYYNYYNPYYYYGYPHEVIVVKPIYVLPSSPLTPGKRPDREGGGGQRQIQPRRGRSN